MNERIKPNDICLIVGGPSENIGAMLTVTNSGVCSCGAKDWNFKDANREIIFVQDALFITIVHSMCESMAPAFAIHDAWLIPVKEDGSDLQKEEPRELVKPMENV